VKSGGHAAFAGASSIENGILVNLAKLNEVTLSGDRKTTRVGAGNVWSDVYEVLDPLGVSVVGGREAGVGVGGLTLGGRLMFHFHLL
jgi:FAD/FMN-containing dehydrogenase